MNILYLHAHDAGRYLQPYGYPVSTPHLQRLAESALVFRNAHAAAPTCSPSRAALLTGRCAHATGMLGLAHRGFELRQPEQHLAAFLGDHGWHTALAGIQHLHCGDAPGRPYREELPADQQQGWRAHDTAVAENACAYLAEAHRDRQESSTAATPFFLDCGFWYPHRPFPELGESDHAADFVRPPAGSVDSAATRADTARFHLALQHMDDCVGRVLEALAAGPSAEDTLVLFTIDHGIAFPGHKCRLNDRGTGVALMLRLPASLGGGSNSGGIRDALVSHLDIFPTLCDLAGLPAPDWLEGVSLRPLLSAANDDPSAQPTVRDQLFSEVTYHAAYEPQRSVRTATHRLIRRFDSDFRPVPANVDHSPGKTALLEAGWLQRDRPEVELYDLQLDPEESDNRADDPALAAVRADLERRLLQWMQSTGDPLLEAPVPPPPGAIVDPRDQIEPS